MSFKKEWMRRVFKKNKEVVLGMGLFFFLFLAIRLAGLNWGEGFFFHPDEGNMARSVAQMKWPDLNPRFFAYGQFPLYLAYFFGLLLNLLTGKYSSVVSFSQAVYLLRFFSLLFSLATVVWGYKLTELLIPKKKVGWLTVVWLFFLPGLIQAAHFGTVESLLTFVALGLVYYSILIYKGGLFFKYLWPVSLLAGMGLASKASAALFLLPVILSFVFRLKKEKKKLAWIGKGVGLGLLSLFFFALFCPYYLLEWQESLRIVRYEAQLASGQSQVFYTRQFLSSLPIWFQLKKIFPWVLGGPLFILSIVASFFNLWQLLFGRVGKEWRLVQAGLLPWFLLNSLLFTKWARFMVPILPFFVLLSVWLVAQVKKRWLFWFLVLISIIPGLLFSKIYWSRDIRIQAMEWLNENLPTNSVIFYEGGNIIDLPGLDHQKFKTLGFDFYELENDLTSREKLEELIGGADYFLSLSRRIFTNHLPDKFPYTANFYRQLFSGELGFVFIKEFKVFSDWEELLVGADLKSEETWTVFDHPTLRLFKKVKN